MFKFISTSAYPNCVHVPNSWNFFSPLFWGVFFHFKNYRLHLKQSLRQFNLLDHRHGQILRWEVHNSSPLPSAQPILPRIAPEHGVPYFFNPHIVFFTWEEIELPSAHSTWRRTCPTPSPPCPPQRLLEEVWPHESTCAGRASSSCLGNPKLLHRCKWRLHGSSHLHLYYHN